MTYLYGLIILYAEKKINSLFVNELHGIEQINTKLFGKGDSMDIRIMRTKKMINDALLELMEKKPVEKITPTELCRKATINRNTFYSHYKSTEQVLEDMENELLDTVDASINESKTPVEAITALCEMMRSNKKLCTVFYSKNSSRRLVQKVFEVADRFNMTKMKNESNTLSENYRQMLSSYTIRGSAAVIECWVQNGMAEEPEQVAEFIHSISKYGTSAVTK